MKSLMKIALAATVMTTINAFATGVPAELTQLVPTGQKSVSLNGLTSKGQPCLTNISSDNIGFSVANFELDANGQVKELAKFQVGLGFELRTLNETPTKLKAQATHEAEESYSSDTRTELEITRDDNGVMTAVRVKEFSRMLVFYVEKSEVLCRF